MGQENQITILYVDDEEFNLFLFEKSFETKYEILTAKSGEEGLKKLDDYAHKIIVVISDMRMPKMNGIEFITKAKEQYSNIIYFILTGFGFDERIETALKEKLIHKFFQKPYDTKEIEEAISEVADHH